MCEKKFGSFLRETYKEVRKYLVDGFIVWCIDVIKHDMLNLADHGENHIEISINKFIQIYAPSVKKLEYKELLKVIHDIGEWADTEGFSRIHPVTDDGKYVDIIIVWGIKREYPKEESYAEFINQRFDESNGGIFRGFASNLIQQIRDELLEAVKNSNRYIVICEEDIANRFLENNGKPATVITKRHNIQLISDIVQNWACDNDITCNSKYNFRMQKSETVLVFI